MHGPREKMIMGKLGFMDNGVESKSGEKVRV